MCGVKTIVVLGSGGHTAEMLTLISSVDRQRFCPIVYVVAAGDTLSEEKVRATEIQRRRPPDVSTRVEAPSVSADSSDNTGWVIARVPRSRQVGQTWWTSVFSSAWAVLISILLLLRHRPSLLVANGPGTCVPLFLVAYALKLVSLGCWRIRTVFIESVCRVETLSLSGQILYPLVDHLVVQWPELLVKYPNAKYLGRLV